MSLLPPLGGELDLREFDLTMERPRERSLPSSRLPVAVMCRGSAMGAGRRLGAGVVTRHAHWRGSPLQVRLVQS